MERVGGINARHETCRHANVWSEAGDTFSTLRGVIRIEYVVKHKSAKLFMTYAVGKSEAALNISHLILSTSSQRVS